jgi:hypothetical protein
MIKNLLKTSVILLGFCASASFAGTINVIVNKSVNLESLDAAAIKAIYMGRRNEFPGGQPVVALDTNEENRLFEKFYKNVLYKNVSDINSYWSRKMFTGGGSPPRQIDSKEELIEMVANNPKFIAYVEGEVNSDKVKVVFSTNIK